MTRLRSSLPPPAIISGASRSSGSPPTPPPPGHRARVALSCATPGIHAAGTVMRSDGLTLPLRPPLKSGCPTDGEWLRAIAERLDARS